jgi:hypothetical protein
MMTPEEYLKLLNEYFDKAYPIGKPTVDPDTLEDL